MKILAINPGSTSTKLGLYQNREMLFATTTYHACAELEGFERVSQQINFRMHAIRETLKTVENLIKPLDAVVGRGGLLHPLSSGVYSVNERMLNDLISSRYGEHASNLGAILAYELAQHYKARAFIVDPVVVDEFSTLARFSGYPGISRRSVFHALNQKATARWYARLQGKEYHQLSLIVAHLGGGISVGIHDQGRVVDVNNALEGEGPFSIERTGSLPLGDFTRLALARDENGTSLYSEDQLFRLITRQGGLVGYAGTYDLAAVESKAIAGDEESDLFIKALAYQVAKEIGSGSTVLMGRIDAIILTGGMAFSEYLTDLIRERVKFIAPVVVIPGDKEIEAMVEGVLTVLQGRLKARVY